MAARTRLLRSWSTCGKTTPDPWARLSRRQKCRVILLPLAAQVPQNRRIHFCDQPAMTLATPCPPASVLVVCLCAQWCGVCRDYRQRFTQVQAQFPAVRFLWIDVEDEADLLD